MTPTRPPLPNPAPAVMLSEASFSHGEAVLFDGISIHLSAGEWSVLLGPSGVGKTTLFRLSVSAMHTTLHFPQSMVGWGEIS